MNLFLGDANVTKIPYFQKIKVISFQSNTPEKQGVSLAKGQF